MNCISMWDLNQPFRVKINGVDSIRLSWSLKEALPDIALFGEGMLYVVAELYHGGVSLAGQKFSQAVPFGNFPRWNQWMVFHEMPLCQVPRVNRLKFNA